MTLMRLSHDCHKTKTLSHMTETDCLFFYSVPEDGELGASDRVGGHPLQGRRRGKKRRRRVHLYYGGKDTSRVGCEIQWT